MLRHVPFSRTPVSENLTLLSNACPGLAFVLAAV
jgi:hypothetical protein